MVVNKKELPYLVPVIADSITQLDPMCDFSIAIKLAYASLRREYGDFSAEEIPTIADDYNYRKITLSSGSSFEDQ